MRKMSDLFETYVMTLVHPFRIHQHFRHHLPLPNQSGTFEPLTLAEALGISWVFAILRGLLRIVILNFFLQAFLSMQTPEFEFLQELFKSSGFTTYYFLLFSAALDIIFFPIGALIVTEVWEWIIRFYAKRLNPGLPAEEIGHQVAVHALSSHLFSIIPFVGDFIQSLIYFFLLYAGLRSNLGASKSLSAVILLTPMVLGLMLMGLLSLILFYLVA